MADEKQQMKNAKGHREVKSKAKNESGRKYEIDMTDFVIVDKLNDLTVDKGGREILQAKSDPHPNASHDNSSSCRNVPDVNRSVLSDTQTGRSEMLSNSSMNFPSSGGFPVSMADSLGNKMNSNNSMSHLQSVGLNSLRTITRMKTDINLNEVRSFFSNPVPNTETKNPTTPDSPIPSSDKLSSPHQNQPVPESTKISTQPNLSSQNLLAKFNNDPSSSTSQKEKSDSLPSLSLDKTNKSKQTTNALREEYSNTNMADTDSMSFNAFGTDASHDCHVGPDSSVSYSKGGSSTDNLGPGKDSISMSVSFSHLQSGTNSVSPCLHHLDHLMSVDFPSFQREMGNDTGQFSPQACESVCSQELTSFDLSQEASDLAISQGTSNLDVSQKTSDLDPSQDLCGSALLQEPKSQMRNPNTLTETCNVDRVGNDDQNVQTCQGLSGNVEYDYQRQNTNDAATQNEMAPEENTVEKQEILPHEEHQASLDMECDSTHNKLTDLNSCKGSLKSLRETKGDVHEKDLTCFDNGYKNKQSEILDVFNIPAGEMNRYLSNSSSGDECGDDDGNEEEILDSESTKSSLRERGEEKQADTKNDKVQDILSHQDNQPSLDMKRDTIQNVLTDASNHGGNFNTPKETETNVHGKKSTCPDNARKNNYHEIFEALDRATEKMKRCKFTTNDNGDEYDNDGGKEGEIETQGGKAQEIKPHSTALTIYDCQGEEPAMFSALLCVAPQDVVNFGLPFLSKLKSWGFRVFLPETDLILTGPKYENLARVIKERCNSKLIVIVSKDFPLSQECLFLLYFAKHLDPAAQQRSIIPIYIDKNIVNLPNVLKGLSSIQYNQAVRNEFLQPKLTSALGGVSANTNQSHPLSSSPYESAKRLYSKSKTSPQRASTDTNGVLDVL